MPAVQVVSLLQPTVGETEVVAHTSPETSRRYATVGTHVLVQMRNPHPIVLLGSRYLGPRHFLGGPIPQPKLEGLRQEWPLSQTPRRLRSEFSALRQIDFTPLEQGLRRCVAKSSFLSVGVGTIVTASPKEVLT